MEVYAREFTRAFDHLADCPVSLHGYYPFELGRLASSRNLPWIQMAARYLIRYGAYQWQVRGRTADINHIVDHGYGHLAFSLDPRRTVVTFHDAMLLKLARRELPTSFYPRLTILGHRLSLAAIRRCAWVLANSATCLEAA